MKPNAANAAKDDPQEAAFALREERLNLEREQLAIERERLAAERAHAEAEARLAAGRRPLLGAAPVTFLALFCFALGVIAGIAVSDYRSSRRREANLRALGRIGDVSLTNSIPGDASPRNVSVVVFQ